VWLAGVTWGPWIARHRYWSCGVDPGLWVTWSAGAGSVQCSHGALNVANHNIQQDIDTGSTVSVRRRLAGTW